MHSNWSAVALVAVLTLHISASFGQEAGSLKGVDRVNASSGRDTDSEKIDRWFAIYDAEAASYELSIAGKSPAKLKLLPLPLLSYTNPVRSGQQHGSFYVWTRSGRPQAIVESPRFLYQGL